MTTDLRRPTLARFGRPLLLASVGLAALVLGGCSSGPSQPVAYVHTDPGMGLITNSDSLGAFVAARVNTERREARARLNQPTALTRVEAQ
jgi:hypothetical protein